MISSLLFAQSSFTTFKLQLRIPFYKSLLGEVRQSLENAKNWKMDKLFKKDVCLLFFASLKYFD